MIKKFTVEGRPVGKARPKFVRKTGRAYTPKNTVEYEERVKAAYLEKYKPDCTEDGAYSIKIQAYFPIPKSDSKKKHEEKLMGVIKPTIKADLDNIVKCILDGLQGVAFKDDKQVVLIMASKDYSDVPRVVVTIHNIDEGKNE